MAPNLPLPPQLSTDPSVNASAMAWAGQLVDGLQKILTGTDGSVAFLKLATPASRKIAFGVASLTWAAAAFNSNIATVAHPLGVAPLVVVAIAQGGGTPAHFFCNARNFTATGFDLQGNVAQPDAAPGVSSQNAFWVAIA